MEFQSLTNIEASFQRIKLVVIVFFVASVCINGFVIWKSYEFAEAQREKVYILEEGKSIMAILNQDIEQNRPVEIRAHLTLFHKLLFHLSPDGKAMKENFNRALVLGNESVSVYNEDIKESGYYNRIISGNIHQKLELDSITCNFNSYPYPCTTYARVFIERSTNVTERSLITTCTVRKSLRSDDNPLGYFIENFEVKENKDLGIYKR